MTTAREPTEAKIRRQLSEAEATVETLRAKLAKIEARKTGEKPAATWLDLLWSEAPKMARQRGTKHQCLTSWKKIPDSEKPSIETMLSAMKAWKQCDQWQKDQGSYIPGLHRWIGDRFWEAPPEIEAAPSRARSFTKAIPTTNPDEVVTDRAEIARLLSLDPKNLHDRQDHQKPKESPRQESDPEPGHGVTFL